MSDQINLEVDYFDHIKTIRLVGLLGRGTELLPIRLWCYVGRYHAESGKITNYSPQEIETVVLKWWGKSGEAIDALLKTGFLDKAEGGYVCHGWKERNGHIEAFKERARTAATTRWDRVRKQWDSNAQALLEKCPNLTTVLPNELPNYLTSGLKANAPEIYEWLQYKKERRETYQPRGFQMLLRRLEKIPADRRKEAVEHSMANNWAGIFEPKGGSNGTGNSPGGRRVVEGDHAAYKPGQLGRVRVEKCV